MAGTNGIALSERAGQRPGTSPWRVLLLLLAIAAAVRLYVLLNTAVIAIDGVQYTSVAKLYASFRFREALSHYFPPMYPLLMALLHLPGISWELAGQLVSFFAGVLTILPLYFLVRKAYSPGPGASVAPDAGTRIAWVTVLFFAFLPDMVRHSTQVRSEACYILFATCAVYFGWQSASSGRARHFVFLGLFSALAYLTRPEGLCLLLICLAWVAAGPLRRLRLPWRQRLKGIALSLLLAAVIAGSYVAYISSITAPDGEPPGLRLTLKGSPFSVLRGEWIGEKYRGGGHSLPEVSFPRWLQNFGENLGRLLLRNLHLLLLPLLLLALARRRENPRAGPFEAFIFSIVLFNIGVFAFMRVSYRLPAQLVSLLLFLPAFGYFELAGITRKRFKLSEKSARCFKAAVMIVIIAVMSAELVAPARIKRQGVRLCGEWIKRQGHDGAPRIATDLGRVAFYAEGTPVDLPARRTGRRRKAVERPGLERLLASRSADYLAVDTDTLPAEDLRYLHSLPGLRFLGTFRPRSGEGQPIILFKLIEDPAPHRPAAPE